MLFYAIFMGCLAYNIATLIAIGNNFYFKCKELKIYHGRSSANILQSSKYAHLKLNIHLIVSSWHITRNINI